MTNLDRRRSSVLLLLACASLAATAQGRAPVAPASCGNGLLDPGESCDDGNRTKGDGCTAACEAEEQCYERDGSFSFFSWSDSYTGAGRSGVIRVFGDAVDRSRHPDRVLPRFWISTGDIPFISSGPNALDELNQRIGSPFRCTPSPKRFPYFVALGNHDVAGYAKASAEQQYAYWSGQLGPRLDSALLGMQNFREGPHLPHEARTTYSFDYQDAHIVVLNQYHADPNYPTKKPRACIGPQLLAWLDQDLAATRRPVKFVFGHEPAWPFCSAEPGYGGKDCPTGHVDNLTPSWRPRPHSTTGAWRKPFGYHWGDSLDNKVCPPGSRDAFWKTLARHKVVAHFVGHTHCYSSRLVQVEGSTLRRRNEISPYAKTGQAFQQADGVWEIDTGQTHTTGGAAYVLTTVRGGVVTFEAYDQRGKLEPFGLVERWSVRTGK
jgi:cysteine-rich repeat protein